jgi:hypothetical protein
MAAVAASPVLAGGSGVTEYFDRINCTWEETGDFQSTTVDRRFWAADKYSVASESAG